MPAPGRLAVASGNAAVDERALVPIQRSESKQRGCLRASSQPAAPPEVHAAVALIVKPAHLETLADNFSDMELVLSWTTASREC